MSPVQNVWRQLVQRRLWPVAIVLVAALAAVPLLLAEDPAPPPPAPPAPAADKGDSELATQPIVSLASTEERAKRRNVLGSQKNPFRIDPPAQAPADNAGGTGAGSSGGQPDAGTGAGSQGGDTSPGGSAPAAPAAPTSPAVPVAPAPAPKTYALQELTVRFGTADGTHRRSVKRLQALPSADVPVLIYMGVLKDGKTAEFLVDHGATPVGDGECKPSPEECETIRLKEGETEFLDVVDEAGTVTEQYQLDLIKIHNGSSASASKASTSRRTASRSRARRSELRSVAGRTSAYLP